MKFDLTDKDKKVLERKVKENLFHKYLANVHNLNFEVGDVLIKKLARYSSQRSEVDREWNTESVSSDNPMPQRYVYIYKDEYGIGYAKQLRVSDGKLGNELVCFTDYDWDNCRFEVDPEYAEHTLLDADFDIKKIHAQSLEQRKLITKMNRKIGIKPKGLKAFNEFFSSMKKGDHYWVSSDFTGKYIQEYEFQGIVGTFTIAQMDSKSDYGWRNRTREPKERAIWCDDDKAIRLKICDVTKSSHSSWRASTPQECYSFDHTGAHSWVFYKQQPAVEDKKK